MNSIKASIKKILNEIKVKEKTPFGWGTEHKIFPSQKFPDRLYKVGEKDSVDRWFEIFKSNPNMFPGHRYISFVCCFQHLTGQHIRRWRNHIIFLVPITYFLHINFKL